MTIATCSVQEAHARQGAGTAHVVDVRTPAEYRALHAEGATLVPLDAFDPAAVSGAIPAGRTIHLLCKTSNRSRMAAQKLTAVGCPCVVIEGGTDAWAAAGLPVVRGKAAMSLERQVRIVAGLLVLTGVVLGYTIHPYWLGLSGFVGAGLTFAGIFDLCPMAMLLAKCPWNR